MLSGWPTLAILEAGDRNDDECLSLCASQTICSSRMPKYLLARQGTRRQHVTHKRLTDHLYNNGRLLFHSAPISSVMPPTTQTASALRASHPAFVQTAGQRICSPSAEPECVRCASCPAQKTVKYIMQERLPFALHTSLAMRLFVEVGGSGMPSDCYEDSYRSVSMLETHFRSERSRQCDLFTYHDGILVCYFGPRDFLLGSIVILLANPSALIGTDRQEPNVRRTVMSGIL